jgi:hypothetical protein
LTKKRHDLTLKWLLNLITHLQFIADTGELNVKI